MNLETVLLGGFMGLCYGLAVIINRRNKDIERLSGECLDHIDKNIMYERRLEIAMDVLKVYELKSYGSKAAAAILAIEEIQQRYKRTANGNTKPN